MGGTMPLGFTSPQVNVQTSGVLLQDVTEKGMEVAVIMRIANCMILHDCDSKPAHI